MNRTMLIDYMSQIKPLDEEAMSLARKRQERLAKPPGSLGMLEDISIKLAGITGRVINQVDKQSIVIMCADNGVCEEGIASAPQSVTKAQTINFLRRKTGASVLASHFGIGLLVVDMGIAEVIPAGLYTNSPCVAVTQSKILNRSLGRGTANLAATQAMPTAKAQQALLTGIECLHALSQAGCQLVGVGEMGIGNTTTSAAVLSALTGRPAVQTVGKGGGITGAAFAKKRDIVDAVCEKYGFASQDDIDPIDVLAKVGGYDIAGMAGVFLGAAIYRVPVVIDGYISAVAALVATKIYEDYKLRNLSKINNSGSCIEKEDVNIADFLFASHKSYERGYQIAIEELGLSPMFHLDMRLGEGSGCPLAFKTIESACAIINEMATFDEADINDDYLEEIRKGDSF